MGPTLAAITFTKVGAQGQASEPEKEQATGVSRPGLVGPLPRARPCFFVPYC